MTGRDTLLDAFDHLFEKASTKLNVRCTAEEQAEAKRHFGERFSAALEIAGQVNLAELPPEVLRIMEQAIDQLSPAQVVGYLAAMPLAQQAQEMLRTIAFQAAEQRLLAHLIDQADDKYGGN